jgi:hypothetical protein
MHQNIDEIAGPFLPQKQVKALDLQWFLRTNPFTASVNIEVCPTSLSQPLISALNIGRFGNKYRPLRGGE